MAYQTPFDKNSGLLVSRFFALIIDGIILLLPSALLLLPGIYLSFELSPAIHEQTLYLQLSAAVVTFLTSFYRPLFFYLKGKTPGMKAMGLALVTMEKKRPNLLTSFKREFPNLLYAWTSSVVILTRVILMESQIPGKFLILVLLTWLGTILWITNALFVIFSPNRTSLGDRWAKTIMIEKFRRKTESSQEFNFPGKNLLKH